MHRVFKHYPVDFHSHPTHQSVHDPPRPRRVHTPVSAPVSDGTLGGGGGVPKRRVTTLKAVKVVVRFGL